MRLPLLPVGMLLVGLALLAAACGGSDDGSKQRTLNVSDLGTGSSEAFVACVDSDECDASAEACKDSLACLGSCEESGECVSYSKIIVSGGRVFGCAELKFAPSQAAAKPTGDDTTTGTSSTSVETETNQETNNEGEIATGDGEATPLVPVGCTGPSIEIKDLDADALAAQLRRSPDGKVAWSETRIRVGGKLQDEALLATTVEQP